MKIIENASETVTLYRGDSSEIKKFLLSKTDYSGLFGIGIYLTDNSDVAKDYTVGLGTTEFRKRYDGFKSKKELIAGYLYSIMQKAGFENALEDLKIEFRRKSWGVDPKNQAEVNEKIYADFEIAKNKLVRIYVEQAKIEFRKRRPELKIAKLTTGEYLFVKANRSGSVTKFNVPKAYLERCLHAEQPLPDDVLQMVRAAFFRSVENGDANRIFDLRIIHKGDEKIGHTFDDFVDGYKINGTRYAWTETRFGGKGENPTLDVLWNGTHSGYHVFGRSRESQEAFISDLEKLGYVGLRYDGGKRLAGGGARGGGAVGLYHNAYILWNEDDIDSFKETSEPVQDDDIDLDLEKGIRSKSILNIN